MFSTDGLRPCGQELLGELGDGSGQGSSAALEEACWKFVGASGCIVLEVGEVVVTAVGIELDVGMVGYCN